MMMKEITLRAYRSEDLPELLRLFHETVREVCAGEYTREQRDAWAPPPEQLDTGAWDRSLRAHVALVAEAEGRIAGFADLAPPDYLDRLYVGKDFQRRGVASALAEALEKEAFGLGAEAVRVHASLTAKPFFEKRGYRVEREQTVRCRGVEMTNFAMKKIWPG